MNITIFGGTKPHPGEPAYAEAERLGALLAAAGHTVITGGYMGTMEASSKGAHRASGKVVGITCQQIEDWRKSKVNPWVTHEHKAETLQERMVIMMDEADVILALPGGIGTLAEIALFWNRMVIEASPRKPLILVGAGWRQAISGLSGALEGYFPPAYLEMLTFVESVDQAAELISTLSAPAKRQPTQT